MAEIIVMPKLSDTMEEGVLASWLKKEGESVEEGDVLAEIETDKATMEYESPINGKILKLVIKPGTKVNLGVPIAVVGDDSEAFDESMLGSGKEKSSGKGEEGSAGRPSGDIKSKGTEESVSKPAGAGSVQRPDATTYKEPSQGRVKASPLARKMAAEKGIELANIQGSGPAGRIIMRDVESAKQEARAPSPRSEVGSTADDVLIPASMMRQTIAKRLHAAKNDAPHFYLTRSIDMSATMAWREKLNADLAKDPNLPKVSVNDIVLLACAKALRRHPDCNASWEGEAIRQYRGVHMAMAVALPSGLITPVIQNCDQKGIREIARSSRELAGRAKAGDLKPEDYSGGTFTVSNLGMFGIEEFTAIINPPQAGILAVGATIPTPWVDNAGQITVSHRMKVTMSCDHRVIDGALGAQFLQTFVSYLEDPLMMLV